MSSFCHIEFNYFRSATPRYYLLSYLVFGMFNIYWPGVKFWELILRYIWFWSIILTFCLNSLIPARLCMFYSFCCSYNFGFLGFWESLQISFIPIWLMGCVWPFYNIKLPAFYVIETADYCCYEAIVRAPSCCWWPSVLWIALTP